jgi:hypothetical protein
VPFEAIDIPDVLVSVEVVLVSDVGDVPTEDVDDVSAVLVLEAGVVLAVVCDVDESSVVLDVECCCES